LLAATEQQLDNKVTDSARSPSFPRNQIHRSESIDR
jgi:hypothetical protein